MSAAFATAIQNPATAGQTYEIAGPDVLTYEQILDEVAAVLGKRKRKLHMPVGLMKVGMSVIDVLPKIEPPVTVDQLNMLALSNTTDQNAVEQLTGRPPMPARGARCHDMLHATCPFRHPRRGRTTATPDHRHTPGSVPVS